MTETVFLTQAKAAREASRVLARTPGAAKDAALTAMARALLDSGDDLLAANAADVAAAQASGTRAWMVDRLRLDAPRIEAMAQGLRDLRGLVDPVGQIVRGWTRPDGVQIQQVRVPFGVLGIIYEARPNVTADAAGIALKSGNAALLRGSSSALASNRVIADALRAGIASASLPQDAIALVEGGYEVTDELMHARGLVDVLIPRGGAGLIDAVVSGATVPVIETGTGNCHLFVDRAADQDMALAIIMNAKTQRPTVCNSLETVLIDRPIAADFMPKAMAALTGSGVTVHGTPEVVALDARIVPAEPGEFDSEYLTLDLAVDVVDDLDAALAHIRDHTTGHSETIVTNDLARAERFAAEVDAAAVLVNASSRFVDGGEFGFGAEIGISTQKLHARGPMGLAEMTSTKYVVRGSGQTRR